MPFPFRKRSLNPKPSTAQSQLHDPYSPLTPTASTPAQPLPFANSLPPPFTTLSTPSDPDLPSSALAPPPHYTQASQTQPPPYNPSAPLPLATTQTRSAPERHARRPSQPPQLSVPSSSSASAPKPVTYEDPKAAELARKASAANREDLKEMLDFFIRQRETVGRQGELHGWVIADRMP